MIRIGISQPSSKSKTTTTSPLQWKSRIRIRTVITRTIMLISVLFILQCAFWMNNYKYAAVGVHGFAFGRATSKNIALGGSSSSSSNLGSSNNFFSSFQSTPSFHSPFTTRSFERSSSFSSSSPSSSRSHSSLLILMGQKGGSKADKQKRRPKSSAAATPPSPPAAAAAPAAPRVSTQINVPIRRQIQFGKINKQYREAAAAGTSFRAVNGNGGNGSGNGGGGKPQPVKRTSYRKNLDEETIQQKALERQRKGQNPDWSIVLNQTKADPLVLVDGYNVIHKWPRLKKHMTRGDTDRARQLLLDDLEGLASLQRWRIECVFDGAGRGAVVGPLGSGPGTGYFSGGRGANNNNNAVGKDPTMTPFGKTGTVRTVYTGGGVEADTYIEGRCAAAKNVTLGHITSSLIVATDDSQIKLVANSAGALCMSSDRFVLELKAVKKGMQYRVEKAMADVNNMAMRPESSWGSSSSSSSSSSETESGERFFQGSAVADDYKTKPRREVLEEHEDGSKLIKARYGANEIIIKDNRNKIKKKKPKLNMSASPVGKKKKKKKKKK